MAATILNLRKPVEEQDSAAISLDARAGHLSTRYASADAQEILRAAIEIFSGKIALVSSFGAESVVLLHLAAQVMPDIAVIFLDTKKHFAQTLSYRKKLQAHLGLTNIINIHPYPESLAREDSDATLWRHDPDRCCTLRKVRPLAGVLENYDAWITGRKQFHGGERMQLPIFDAAPPHIKVNPLVTWSREDVAGYGLDHDLPPHPLVAEGYPSVGCWPCTHPVAQGGDVRDGRWRGAAKTECGIHQV